jgi:hypothetical protein
MIDNCTCCSMNSVVTVVKAVIMKAKVIAGKTRVSECV